MLYLVATVMIPALLVFLWNRKSYREFVRSIVINAPPEEVWALLNYHNPRGVASRGRVVEKTDEPDVILLKVLNGAGKVSFESRIRIFPAPEKFAVAARLEERRYPAMKTKEDFPFGEDALSVSWLEPLDNGATRMFNYERMNVNVFQNLHTRMFMLPGFQREILDHVEHRDRRSSILTPGWIWKIGSTLTAIAAAIWQFGLIEGLAIALVVFLHEVGHAIGYRAVGEKVMGIHLIPFLGGVTIGTAPKTAVRSAIVSLSGTTFSLCLASLVYAGIQMSGLPVEIWPNTAFEPNFGGALVVGLGGMLALNLFQLLPVPFLDGGRTLEAAFSGLALSLRRTLVRGAGAAVVVALYLLDQPFFAVIAFFFVAFGIVFEVSRQEEKSAAFLPATPKTSLAIGGLYLSHIGLYAGMIIVLTLTYLVPPVHDSAQSGLAGSNAQSVASMTSSSIFTTE